MKKAVLIITLAVLVALPLVFGATFVAAEGQDVITIDKDASVFKGGKKKKAATSFNHTEHGKNIKCLDCHHKADQAKLDAGENPASCTGGDCHGPAEKVVDGKKMVDSEDAYHNNCKDCHKKEKKGPTKCKECHPGSK